ncbi:olfactory receptor 11A1-like [Aulostomus maculatus]
MEEELNATYITLGGHVDVHKHRYLYFLIMFTVYILVILCNSTIVGVIWIHRNLHEPMYIFIAALLVNTIVFSTAIYPKMLIDFLSERQIISHPACLFQFFAYYSFGGSEFLLLAAMAYDRYVSICRPLQYPTIMGKVTVGVLLLLAWLLPACQTAVQVILSADMKLCSFTLRGVFCTNSIYDLHCGGSRARSIFGVVAMFNNTVLPTLFILFSYSNIFFISYRSGRQVRKKAAQTCLPHLLVLVSISCMSAFDVSVARLGSDFPNTVRLIMTLQIILYHPLINPIIYGVKMKEISKHLKRLLCRSKEIQV